MIIGLTGFKKSGKSTVATHLGIKYNFQRINMKDALIAEMKKNFPDLIQFFCGLYNMTIDELFEEKPEGFRELMQNYGTEVRRGDKDSYWTEQWRERSYSARDLKQNIVVDDVRFLNEAQAVRDKGGIIIRVVRNDIPTGGAHSSERQQLEITPDYVVSVGKGEQAKLMEEVDAIMQKVNHRLFVAEVLT